MAYDKVVDSAVLDAGLKQIADAIREKGGTADSLAFPQAMADAIAAIEAGGGVKMVTGSFTLAEDTTGTYHVEPDLSPLALPGEDDITLYNKCFAFVALDNPTTLKGTYGFAVFRVKPSGAKVGVSGGYDGSSMYNDAQRDTCNLFYSYGLQLKFGSADARIGLAGHTYRYYIWRSYE